MVPGHRKKSTNRSCVSCLKNNNILFLTLQQVWEQERMENGKQRKEPKVDRKLQQDNSSTRPQRHSLVYYNCFISKCPCPPSVARPRVKSQSSVSSCGPVGKGASVKSHCRF